MNNTIWLIGCSFTEGINCHLPQYVGDLERKDVHISESHKLNNNEREWGQVLKKKIEVAEGKRYKLVNLGRGATSCIYSLYRLIDILKDVKSGDIVIFGYTSIDRDFILTEVLGDNIDFSVLPLTHFTTHYLSTYTTSKKRSKWLEDFRTGIISNYGEEAPRILSDMFYLKTGFFEQEGVHKEGVQKSIYELEFKLVARLVRSTFSFLREIGVECYSWDKDIWHVDKNGIQDIELSRRREHVFENLYGWSNGVIEDSHWSLNGEAYFGEFLYWCINKSFHDNFHISAKYLNSFRKDYGPSHFTYLPYREVVLEKI